MRIAHIGPRLARRGGPSGYLLQLSLAADRYGRRSPHVLTFPGHETQSRVASPTLGDRMRGALRPLKRAIAGPPRFYRPREEDLRRVGGAVDELLSASRRAVCAEAADSVDKALDSGTDVFVAHDPSIAEWILERRQPGQQVWLMMHAPMPFGLDLTWSWSVPEWTWEQVLALPDVGHWIRWEIGVCAAVDRLITPCAEAVGELARVDRRFAELPFEYVVTGAEPRDRRYPHDSRAEQRARWQLPENIPIGLFLSSPLPYRGLDVLLAGVAALPAPVRGMVAIAGASRGEPPSHPRVRNLGMVRDVTDLLESIDFVVNVNRFSLFDLSTIEAAAAGRPMLLHATGGNVAFERLGVGAVMIDDLTTAHVARGLEECFEMSETRRVALGYASRRAYEQHLTLEHLWREHSALYDRAAAGDYASARR